MYSTQLKTAITQLQENVFLETSEDNPIDDGLLDLQDDDGKAKITVTKEAVFDNTIGLYPVTDKKGTIVDKITGKTLTPKDGEDYASSAIANSVANFQVKDILSSESFDINLPGGTLLAPYLIQDGDITDFENNDAEAFFAFGAANSDDLNRFIELRNEDASIFKFSENMTGSNQDDKDMIMEVNLV